MLEDNKIPTTTTGNVSSGTSFDGTDASPGVTAKAELLEIDYVEQVTEAFQPVSGYKREFLNPFPNQTPVNLLARPELVLSETFGTTPATSSLFLAWINKKSKILETFDYLRCDFIIRVMIRCSASIYGAGLVTWKYGQERSFYVRPRDEIHSTGMAYFLDYAGADAVEFTIPFVFPREYWDIRVNSDLQNYFTVYFDELFKTSIAGGDETVNVRVFMNATNIDVGGYRMTPAALTVRPESKYAPRTPSSSFNPSSVHNMMNIATVGAGLARTIGNVFLGNADTGSQVPGNSTSIDIEQMEKGLVGDIPVSNNAASGVKIATYGDNNFLSKAPSLAHLGESRMISGMFPETEHPISEFVKRPSMTSKHVFTDMSGGAFVPIVPNGGLWFQYVEKNFRMWRGTIRLGLHFFTHPLIGARFELKYVTTGLAVPEEGDPAVPSIVFLIKGSESKMIDIPYNGTTYAKSGFEGILYLRCLDPPTSFASGIEPIVYVAVTESGAEDIQFFSMCCIPGPDSGSPTLMKEPVIPESLVQLHSVPAEIVLGSGRAPKTPFLPEVTTIEQMCKRWSLRDGYTAVNPSRFDVVPLNFTLGYFKSGAEHYGCIYDAMADCFYMARSGMEFRAILDPALGGPTVAFAAMANGVTQTTTTGPRNTQAPENGLSICNPTLQPALEYSAPFLSTNNGVCAGETVVTAVNTNLGTFPNTVLYARATEGIALYHQNIIPVLLGRV